MKGNNQNEKRLDALFAKAKQQEPLLNNEQVHNLISHASTSAFPGKQLVHFFNNHLKLIIMSTIVSSIVIGLFMLLPQKGNGSAQLQTNKQSALKSEELVSVKPKSTKHVNYEEKDPSSADVKSEQIGSKTKEPLEPIVEEFPCDTLKEKLYGDEFIISLTLDEFNKLGFSLDTNMWFYYNHSPDSIVTGYSIAKIGRYAYRTMISAIGLARKQMPFTSFDFYPVFITNRYSSSNVAMMSQYMTNFRSCLNCKPDYKKVKILNPKTKQDSVYILKKEFSIKEEFMEWENFEFANDTLIPVTIMVDNSDPTSHNYKIMTGKVQREIADKIFWFKPSSTFYNKLPERYSEKSKNFYESIRKLKENQTCKQADIVTYFSIDRMNNTISGIPKLILTKNELNDISINIFNDSLVYSHSDGTRNFCLKYSYKRTQVGLKPLKHNLNKSDSTYSFKMPLKYASNYNGERNVRWNYEENQYNLSKNSDMFFLENINRLIAVKIDKELCENCLDEDMIFWFSPDKDFLNALPERYKDEIKTEYNSLLIHSNPNISQQVKDTTPKYCTYFEECRPTFPEIETLKIYPNPANDIANIEFKLTTNDKIRIVLFDIEGKPVRVLKDMEKMQAGTNSIQINMASFPSGIYILTLQNNNGRYKTQRIVKQ